MLFCPFQSKKLKDDLLHCFFLIDAASQLETCYTLVTIIKWTTRKLRRKNCISHFSLFSRKKERWWVNVLFILIRKYVCMHVCNMSCVVAIQFLHPTLFLLMRNERRVCVVRKILKRMKKEENQRATVVPFFFDMPCNSLMHKSFNTKQHQTSRRLTTAKSSRAFLCYSRVSLSACKKY